MKSKFYTSKITPGEKNKGQFVLNASCMKHLGLKGGDKFYFFPSANGTLQISSEPVLEIPVINLQKAAFASHEIV